MKSAKLFAASIAAVSVFALAACGSDAESSSPTPAPTETATAASQDIVALAAATPDLSTLVAAVGAADLATTLQGAGPFTVFAPTNAAFEKLPAGLVDQLLLPCNKAALTTVLTYHVVPAAVKAADITPGDVATVEGSTVKLATSPAVTVNDATVTTADVVASNGVVHIIDGVLVPPSVDPSTLKTSC